MDGDPSDLQLLVASARHEVATIRDDYRLNLPLPGKRGVALKEHILDLLGAVEHRAQQEPPATAAQAARSAFARSLRQSIVVLRAAHAALPWLAAVCSPSINLGSLYLTEECARILVKHDVDLVMVPDFDYMYMTTSWPFGDVINSTSGFVPSAIRRPIVLNYPLTDDSRLLMHSIFAHELGHASCDEYALVDHIEGALNNDPGFVAAFQEIVDTSTSAAASPAETAGAIRTLLRRWIEEVLCDHLAIETTGPAFVWGFVSFALPLTYGKPAPSHPPNTLRLRLALDHLNDRGWRSYMEHVAPKVTTWMDSIGDDATDSMLPHFAFLREQLLHHAPVIRKTATDRVGSAMLDPSVVVPEANEAAGLIRRLILPVGLKESLQPRSILLGGWQEAFHRHGDSPAGIVAALSDSHLQDLIGKAIEMSVVREAWNQQ
jgi:hypothetical protein